MKKPSQFASVFPRSSERRESSLKGEIPGTGIIAPLEGLFEMQRPVREHISYLEQKIEALGILATDPARTPVEQREAIIDLGIAERALVHFRRAIALEEEISH